jgi:carbon storage regulator
VRHSATEHGTTIGSGQGVPDRGLVMTDGEAEYTQTGSAWIKADRVISDAKDLRPVFSNNKARRCLVLVLSRKANQEICIGDDIRVMVIEIRGDKVRLGVTAPRDTSVHRHEIYDAIKQVIESNDSDCD